MKSAVRDLTVRKCMFRESLRAFHVKVLHWPRVQSMDVLAVRVHEIWLWGIDCGGGVV